MYNKNYTLITGASEGFGKALAIECAQRKMNLILVALPGPELYILTNFIRKNYAIEVIGIEKDLSKEEGCFELFNKIALQGLKVNMLINNAGIGSTAAFEEGSVSLFQKQIKVNVLATALITRHFLPLLKKNSPSYILNVGSLASFFCLPNKEVYAATKSFIYHFSKSLYNELKKDNIHVSVLCPGGMNTNLLLTMMNRTGNFLSRLSIMEPEEVAPIAIRALLRKKEVIIPGTMNQLFLALDKVLPGFIKKKLRNRTMRELNPNNRFINSKNIPIVQPLSEAV